MKNEKRDFLGPQLGHFVWFLSGPIKKKIKTSLEFKPQDT